MKLDACSLVLVGALAGSLPAHGADLLAPHRAVYDIALESATDRSGIHGINGRMVYEFGGSPCEGYTVKFRFVTEVRSDEATQLTDQRTTTWEDGKGSAFTFSTRSYVDGQLDQEIRGNASSDAGRTVVEMVKPETARHELGPALFPTRHMIDLLQHIERGETFYETTIFDASDAADEVLSTSIVIGRRATASAGDADAAAAGALAGSHYWPVSMAYFAEPEERGEEIPVYRVDFRLHGNGVSRSLVMDYGDFALKGTLVDLDLFEMPGDCAP